MNDQERQDWAHVVADALACDANVEATWARATIAADKHIRDLEEQVEQLQLAIAWEEGDLIEQRRIESKAGLGPGHFHRLIVEAMEAGWGRLEAK